MNMLFTIGKLIVTFFFFLLIAITGAFIGVLVSYSPKLPDIDSIDNSLPSQSTKIYAKDKTLLANLFIENRTIVPISSIPENLKLAIIAIEDAKFYEHKGIDISGIIRAFYKNIRGQKIIEGGSTITQQLARNLFLSHRRTFARKIKEILISFQMERKYSKDEILELYLNQIYFGEGAYGVESAAQTYFGKSVDKLNLAEASLLAGIPKSPLNYSPYTNFDLSKQRQEIVLSRMLEVGFITEEEYINAKNYQLKFLPKPKYEGENYVAPYFTSYVIDQLINKFGATNVFRGGLRVYTTLDMEMQKHAENAIENALKEAQKNNLNISQGALVAIEPQTGHILAMVGGKSWQESKFNRATQAKRQPGSAFKPFVYAAAIDKGFAPNSLVEDAPVEYRAGAKIWKPQNYDKRFRGILTFRKALALSVNIPAVKIAEQVGIDTVIEYARKMGLTSVDPINDRNLALSLGGLTYGVSPLEMASAFSVFAAEGIKHEPISILKIENSNGVLIEEARQDKKIVLSKRTALILTDMLRDVIKYGTGTGASIGRDAAGKTGTTSDFRDCWFVGFTPQISCAVWFGNDNNTPTNKVVGGQLPARTWAKFMKEAHSKLPVISFSSEYAGWKEVEKNIDEVRKIENTRIEIEICSQSNLTATPYCPEPVTKKFPEGEEPVQICNLHLPTSPGEEIIKQSQTIEVDICKISGKLANEYCSEIIVKEMTRDKIPSQVCDIHTRKTKEEISF